MRLSFSVRFAAPAAIVLAAGISIGGLSLPAPASAVDAAPGANPTLAEMTAARNHTMGSTVAEHEGSPTTASPNALTASPASMPPGLPGLDVSSWQSNINWSQVAANGAKFAYVKATEGTWYRSGQFSQQYNGSYSAGLIRGAYHFAVPNTSSGAAQANYFVDNGGGWSANGKTLPPLLDIEYDPYTATDHTNSCFGLTAAQMINWISDFSNTVLSRTGMTPAIYTTTDWWKTCTGNSAAFSKNPLFIARYPSQISYGPGTLPASWSSHAIWQYADSGIFPGDQDVFNGDYAALKALAAPTPSVSPVGNFEVGSATLTEATLRGWVLDPETSAPIYVHLYINGTYQTGVWGGQFLANVYRSDVGAAYPGYGPDHGFEIHFPVTAGSLTACVYGINVGGGDSVLLGCKNIATPTGPPIGNVDSASVGQDRKATISGWALDPDTASSISVQVSVNGTLGASFSAQATRNDVATAYPGYGSQHGFSVTVPVPVGTNTICMYGVNVGGGANSLLSCRDVSTASGPPIGNIDAAKVTGRIATLSGWALDPDTPDSITVHAYVDGAWGGAYTADATRNDVAAAYDGYGAQHGFTVPLQLSGGVHQVCLYGINVKAGYNALIGCSSVSMPTGSPFGNVDSVAVTGGLATVAGWAIDPDVAASIDVHVYVNGQWVAAHTASAPRADVSRAYPGYGENHGFAFQVAVPTGSSQVCVYGINQGAGGNSLIRCVTAVR